MLRLEEFMERQKLHHDGVSITEIGCRLGVDRKTVRKYLRQAPRPYRRKAKPWKVDAHRSDLRERWEQGVHNAQRLFGEVQKRGYRGCYTQVKKVMRAWRREAQERAFVRFETAPGEQSQMDWGHFGNWAGARLYAFVLLLCSMPCLPWLTKARISRALSPERTAGCWSGTSTVRSSMAPCAKRQVFRTCARRSPRCRSRRRLSPSHAVHACSILQTGRI